MRNSGELEVQEGWWPVGVVSKLLTASVNLKRGFYWLLAVLQVSSCGT